MDLLKKRKQIDKLDRQVMETLSKRFEVVREVGKIKKKIDLPVQDLNREKQMHKKLADLSINFGINLDFTQKLFELILKESKRLQKDGS